MFKLVPRTVNRLLLLLTMVLVLRAVLSFAGDQGGDPVTLIDKYHKFEESLAKTSPGIQVHLYSDIQKNSSSADIYGIFDHPFDIVEKALSEPSEWCEIVLPHINIRACTSSNTGSNWLLTLYNVTKYYQPIEEATQLKYSYYLLARRPDYMDILFRADDGPFHSHDHRLKIEAMPIGQDKTFVHLSYSYRYGTFSYMTMKSYFGLFGGKRVGFSTTGVDSKGGPVYVSGLKGAVERNVMRYYLAVEAYLDTLKYPAEQRFEKRISHWYDLTARFKRQLFEMEKKEYLDYKRRDIKNQMLLQNAYKPQ